MKRKRMTRAQRDELRRALELYHPCACGIHVCGDKDGAAASFGNVPARSEAEARAVFAAAKAEAECLPGEEWGLVVDLNLSWDNLHVEDFGIMHQMLDRCLAAGRAALSSQNSPER